MGSASLGRDQQVASHSVSAQSQPKGFGGLPTHVCSGGKGGGRGGLRQSSSKVILPSVIEEGVVSLLRSEGLGRFGELVCSIFSTMAWRFISAFFRNISNFDTLIEG